MYFLFKDKKFIYLLSAVIVVVTLEILSLLNVQIPMPFAPFVYALFILGIGYKILLQGVKALLKFNFSSINLLMTIAILAAFYLQEYTEAAVVIVLYVLGEHLEDLGIDNSKSALEKLVSQSPKVAFVKELNEFVPIEKIKVGTILQIKPGDYILLDARVTLGNTSIDEAAITGEPLPKEKNIGDTVFAGTLNKNGFIEIETTKLSSDTTFSKIIQLSFEANTNKSDTQKFIQRFAKIYTPSILFIAVLIIIIPVLFLHQDFDHWLQQAITLLVIACPCALVISTPVAIYAALGNASSKGILVKGGKYIESIASIRAIALDKTRTITYGNPVVSDVITLMNTTKEELLACTAGVEMYSEHPIAQAIVKASKEAGFEPHHAVNFESIFGKGAKASCTICNNESITLGKLDFIKEYEANFEEAEIAVKKLSNEGKSSVIVSFGNGIAGVIGLTDQIKSESIAAVQSFKKLGIQPIILSGDNENAVKYIASQIGINQYFGNLLPEDKALKVDELIAKYDNKVAMVGDGINDTPALAKATVGISMGAAGSDTAIEAANVALMNDNLSNIPFLIMLGKKTLSCIKQNTIGAIIVKLLFIILAVLGYSNLVFAIAADVGVTLFVILISLRLTDYNPKL